MTGLLRRGALVRRGVGELYVMVIIIVILVIALTIMYTVMNGFTRYVMEQRQEIATLASAKTNLETGLKNFTCSGYSCIAAVSVSGATIITGPSAVCVFRNATVSVVSKCTYSVGSDGMVSVEIPPELISDAQLSRVASSITIYLPGSDGLVPGITLYIGPVIVYAVSGGSGNYTVIVVNNSTGWVNATLLVNNQPYSSHVVPPTGSYVFTNVPSGTYTLLVNGIINEAIPIIKSAQEIPSAQTVPAPPQCNYFRVYYDNGSLSRFSSAWASSNNPGAGSNPNSNTAVYGTATITNNVLGATAPIHYSSEMIITTGSPPYYAMWIYYVSGYSISAATYNSFAAAIYPTLYTPNDTIYFIFVKVSNRSGNYVYASILSINYPAVSSYGAPGTGSIMLFQKSLASLVLGNSNYYNNVTIVSEGGLLENTWQVVEGVIPSNVGPSARITEVGFGTFFVYSSQASAQKLPVPSNGLWYPGNMYIDYLCVGRS